MQTPTQAALLWRLLARLPLPLLHATGSLLGWLFYLLPNHHRAITLRNLRLCYPEYGWRRRHRLARRSLVETGKALLEVPALWLEPPEVTTGRVREVCGLEHLERALACGKGAIAASPHLGCWEIVGLWLGRNYPLTSLFRPPRQSRFADLMRAARSRTGGRLVPTDGSGIRAVRRALAAGEVVGILPDQEPRGGGAFAPFFGHSAYTMTLTGRLAAGSGAALVPCYAERLPRGRGYRLHFLPAAEDIDADDPERAAAALNRAMEACIRRLPEQYQWCYKRFRSRPPGQPPLYQGTRRFRLRRGGRDSSPRGGGSGTSASTTCLAPARGE